MKLRIISTTAFGLLVFAILNFLYPGLMNYHEQNQLFLFTSDYFVDRIATCGGLSDYVSEFLVQFFYVPAYGAWICAIALCLIQLLTFANFRDKDERLYFLSFLPSILIFLDMGDENLLFSFIVSIVFALLYIKISNRNAILSLALLPLLFWLIGAVSAVCFIYTAYLLYREKKFIVIAIVPVIYCLSAVCSTYLMPHQYPVSQVLLGVNYYRIPGHYHFMMFFVPIVAVGLILMSDKIKIKIENKIALYAAQYSLVFLSFLFVNVAYDQLKFRLINYDYWLRHRCYNNIIHQSEKHQPQTDFERVCINLSLAQRGMLAERMFDMPQDGCAGLLSDAVLDNMSCLPSIEASFNLGMINTSLQFAFDAQESIMNNRKSGRLLKRMAECFIIDKKYNAARHYLLILSHSFYYSDWADKYLQLIATDSDDGIGPLYQTLRQYRFKEDFIFYYPELAKMLGKLYMENRGNDLARQYFYAAMLLNGDLQTFATFYQGLREPVVNMPKSYQEAWALILNGTHRDISGMQQNKFGYNYWTYYFCNVSKAK